MRNHIYTFILGIAITVTTLIVFQFFNLKNAVIEQQGAINQIVNFLNTQNPVKQK